MTERSYPDFPELAGVPVSSPPPDWARGERSALDGPADIPAEAPDEDLVEVPVEQLPGGLLDAEWLGYMEAIVAERRDPTYPLLEISRLRMGIDGKGVTTLVAGAGCPLRCRYCINARLLREKLPTRVTASQLVERLRIDDLYFRATGGGVCFGGGEPLLHIDFLERFRELAPGEWKITLETSLAVLETSVVRAASAADFFIVDCKSMDPGIYARYTGGDGARMERLLRRLLELVGPERIRVRVPLIEGYNSPEDQARSAAQLRELGVTDLDLFSYRLP